VIEKLYLQKKCKKELQYVPLFLKEKEIQKLFLCRATKRGAKVHETIYKKQFVNHLLYLEIRATK
jgi:hypothetical protein